MDVSSSSRSFPSLHIVLNAGLHVASEKMSKPAKQENSDIELQACDGNSVNGTSTYPSDRISACSCSFGSIDVKPTLKATAVFLFFEEFFLPGILQGNPRNSDR